MNYNNRILNIIGHIFFITLITYAVVYFIERVVYLDSAAQIYEMINGEGFKIYVERYSMAIQQVIPLLAIRLHLPLKTILISYSISFFIISYIIFLITAYKFKNKHGIILLLLSTIGISHTFFHAISETFQLLIYGSFFFITINANMSKTTYIIINSLIVIIMFFIHPVSIFFITFVIMFKFIEKINLNDYRIYFFLILLVLLFLFKKIFISTGSHDTSFLNELKYADKYLLNLFKLESTKYFINHFLTSYIIPSIFIITTSIYYFVNKKFIKLILINGFIAGFLLVSLIIYNKGDGPVGMERSFLPFYFFTLIPFIYDFVFSLKKPILVSSIILIILLPIEFINITKASDKYVQSIKDTKLVLNKMDKLQISKAQFFAQDMKPMATNWSIAIESLLLSSSKGRDSSKTFFLQENYDLTLKENNNNSFFMTYYWKYTSSNLQKFNKEYFNLPNIPYKVEYNFNPTIIINNEFFNNNLSINRIKDTIYYSTNIRDTTYAFYGEYCYKTDSNNTIFGFKDYFDIPNDIDSIIISVKRKGGLNGYLVFENDGYNIKSNNAIITNNNWETLEIILAEDQFNKNYMFKTYAINQGKKPIWFDDFTIRIVKKQ